MLEQYLSVLKHSKLFSGVGEDSLSAMLGCLQARTRAYVKNEYVLREGERLEEVCILLSGTLHVQQDDYWGNHTIFQRITSGELFGEAYAVPDSGAFPNDVVALEDSTVLFLNTRKILQVCSSACPFHCAVVRNLFITISEKNRHLTAKLGHLSQRTTREKLLSYLSEESKKHGSAEFDIPFNRQQLADFLSVDRSAMSAELCRMRDEELLRFDRNHFVLLETT